MPLILKYSEFYLVFALNYTYLSMTTVHLSSFAAMSNADVHTLADNNVSLLTENDDNESNVHLAKIVYLS